MWNAYLVDNIYRRTYFFVLPPFFKSLWAKAGHADLLYCENDFAFLSFVLFVPEELVFRLSWIILKFASKSTEIVVKTKKVFERATSQEILFRERKSWSLENIKFCVLVSFRTGFPKINKYKDKPLTSVMRCDWCCQVKFISLQS